MEENGIQEKINKIAAKYDADFMAYFGDVGRPHDSTIIDYCASKRLRKNVILYLATYGGDPNAGYRIGRALQRAYKTIEPDKKAKKKGPPKEGEFTVFIDGMCKSAGTIICLGADKLIMNDDAELGPIDMQLRKENEVGERTSGLTPIQALQFLETQSTLLFRRHFRSMRFSEDLGFSTKMSAELAATMTVGLLQPIYSQIDPIRLAEVDRSLKIAREYGLRLQNSNLHEEALGGVDKVDSQLALDVIQDCFLGGSLGSRFDERQGVGVFCAVRDRDRQQERSAA